MVLKITISIKAKILIVEKAFISNQEICYNGLNFYWPPKKKKIQVMTAIKKHLGKKIMVNYKTDHIYHPYFMLLEICELNP